MRQTLKFWDALQDDRFVATVAPTPLLSVWLACRNIDFRKPHTVLEYGPGTGAFTRYLLRRITSDSSIIAIERNPQLADFLKKTIDDSRFHLIRGSAEDVKEIVTAHGTRPDIVVSGIPFSMLNRDTTGQIIADTWDVMEPGGQFVVYQLVYGTKRELLKVFPQVETTIAVHQFFMPMWIFTARRT